MASLPLPAEPAPDAEPEYAIGELCAQTGLSPRTVRYYEEVGLLPGVRRRAGGRRVYGDDALERLRFIGRLKTLGLSLGEIRELNDLYALAGSTQDMLGRLHGLLGEHLAELEGRIESLVALRDQMQGYREHVARRLDDRREPPSAAGRAAAPERAPAADGAPAAERAPAANGAPAANRREQP